MKSGMRFLLSLAGLGLLALAWWSMGTLDPQAPEKASDHVQERVPASVPGLWGHQQPEEESRTIVDGAPGRGETEPSKMITILGQVVAHEGGKPVGGAFVFAVQPHDVQARGGTIRKPGHAVSDEAGHFTITGLESGTWMVFVQGGGWISVGLAEAKSGTWNPFVHEYEGDRTEPLELRAEPAAKMKVSVSDFNGRPAADLDVLVHSRGLWAFHLRELEAFKSLSRGRTDKHGVARFHQVIPGLGTKVIVRRENLVSESRGPFTLRSGERRDVSVRLPEPRWVDVRVVDGESGKPVSGAQLQVVIETQGRKNAFLRQGLARMAVLDTGETTDANGRAHVSVVPGHNSKISAKAEGYYVGSSGLGAMSAQVTDDLSLLEITLTRALSISGRVIVPDGAKPTDVGLMLRLDEHSRVGTRAREDGTFSFGDLRAGPYDLFAEVLLEDRVFTATQTVRAGADDVTLVLVESERESEARARMLVRVLGLDGEPVKSCRVVLTGLGQGCSHAYPPRGSEGGVVSLELLAGELWLDVFNVEQGRLGSTRIGPIEPRASMNVQLQVAQAIVGRVLGPVGEAVHGAVVTAESPYPHTDIGLQEHARTFTDEDGRFELRGLSDMAYVLSCEPSLEYLVTEPMRVAGGTSDIVIRLESAPEVVIQLVDSVGKPVSGAHLRVQYSDFKAPQAFLRDELDNAVSDASGNIRLRGLDPRRLVFLDVEPPEGRTDLRAIHREKWRLASGTVRFESGRILRGLVVDEQGVPIPRAQVEWTAPEGGWHRRDVWCDAEGRFTLSGLPAGPIDLYAKFDGLLLDEDHPETLKRVSVEDDEVRLEVNRGASATIRIEPWRGRMGGGRALLVERSGASDHSRRLASADVPSTGQVTFQGLRADERYTLWVG